MTNAIFAIPGELATATGGYAYARCLLREAQGLGFSLTHWPLPDGFPHPSDADLADTVQRLNVAPAGWPILFDGLAFGALPMDVLEAIEAPIVALCHHPLALETGLDSATAAELAESERRALGFAAQVVTTSRATAEILVRDFNVDPARISVAPPGTDPAPMAAGSGGSGVSILSVGSLTPRKGHDLLIHALARLADRDWRLTILGAPALDPDHAGMLDGLISKNGLQDRVMLGGAVDRPVLEAAYHEADLFALASHYEGYGMVYAEALAHGLPVLGTDVGAIREATLGAACLIPPGDEGALTAALADLLDNPAGRAALATEARQAAGQLPRWPDTARTIIGALHQAAT